MSRPRFPDEAADWLGVDQALRRILDAAEPLPAFHIPLAEAHGHLLALDVAAAVTLPPWPNSAMDGYALRASDLPEVLGEQGRPFPVEGEVRAGTPRRGASAPGTALRIMTGAPVPEGFDTVVRVEDTDREDGEAGVVRILRTRDRGRNVRAAGEDMTAGEILLRAGERVTPGRMALLAASGCATVPVIPRPRVAIVPTGDELRTPGDFDDVRAGLAVPESNGPALAAACEAVGAHPLLLPPVPDDPEALRDALSGACRDADVLVTLGGASMGTADLVKQVLDTLDFRLDFWRIRMRPGSPFSLGWLPGPPRVPVFGLPGNPASSFVTFQLLVRPFLLALAGETEVHRPVVDAVAGESFRSLATRTVFQRVMLEVDDAGGLVAVSTGPQGSGLVQSLGRAQGLAVVGPGASCPAGTPVPVVLLDDGPNGASEPGYLTGLGEGPSSSDAASRGERS